MNATLEDGRRGSLDRPRLRFRERRFAEESVSPWMAPTVIAIVAGEGYYDAAWNHGEADRTFHAEVSPARSLC